jgi:flagellar biosynthesis/type III secretory pathway chaperone
MSIGYRVMMRIKTLAAKKHPVVLALDDFAQRLTKQANMAKRVNPQDAKELLAEVAEAKQLATRIQELHEKQQSIQATERKVQDQLTEMLKQASVFVTVSEDTK